MALTRRQRELLDFLADFVERNNYSPSYEEIAQGMDLASLATVHKHISSLQEKGYLSRTFNHSRSLELTRRYWDETNRPGPLPTMGVRLEGRIAAGVPIESFGSNETLYFSDFKGDKDTYALEVRGDSMIEDHICSGDFVLVERTDSVRDGEIVVALVGGSEATLKRLYREADGVIRLQPANAAMQPIRVPAADVQVQGRLLAVMRKY